MAKVSLSGRLNVSPRSELIEFASALGYRIVSAGKGKNNPLNHYAVPDDYREEAIRRNMNPRMLVEFVDGSKTMVEMACIANATGLVPDVPGMHGPRADRDDMVKVLIPREDGGILGRKGVVDFTIGKGVAPGVFNADGSVRVPEGPGSAAPGMPPGAVTQEIANLDRAGTWLKRKPTDFEPTSFDKYWVPNESLLAEWVRKSIKEVLIPIPGTNKRIRCAVALLALGGACGITDPNLNEQPVSARPPPPVPFKPHLQEDNGSVKPGTPPGISTRRRRAVRRRPFCVHRVSASDSAVCTQ